MVRFCTLAWVSVLSMIAAVGFGGCGNSFTVANDGGAGAGGTGASAGSGGSGNDGAAGAPSDGSSGDVVGSDAFMPRDFACPPGAPLRCHVCCVTILAGGVDKYDCVNSAGVCPSYPGDSSQATLRCGSRDDCPPLYRCCLESPGSNAPFGECRTQCVNGGVEICDPTMPNCTGGMTCSPSEGDSQNIPGFGVCKG